MKPIICALFVLALATTLRAQPGSQSTSLKTEADNYYNAEQYNLAIQFYRELLLLSDQNAEVNYQLAESYRKTFNYTEAEVYYLKTLYQSPEKYPLSSYYYSLMLKLNGNYDESITRFSEFILVNELNSDLKEFVEQAFVDRAGSEMAKTEKGKNEASVAPLNPATLNSVYNDFAPALRDSNAMVITSSRIASNRQLIDERYGEGFTGNFYFVKSGNSWIDRTRQLFSVNNTRFNDGSGCFNSKGDAYYFTICGQDGPNCKIYKSTFKNNRWTGPVALNDNINIKNYESKHPAISKGGDTLLFSSNRPNGFGQFDIWVSTNAGGDSWGPATNLGAGINTKLNELAPAFCSLPNIFFMSSDGHQNYGGLDLYMVKRFSNGTLGLFNLDYPFNSNRDDCFITLSDANIYFSSNRLDGKGGFDIYSTRVPSVLSFVSRISLKNRDARSDVKLNARLDRITRMDLITARNEDKIEYENLTYEKKKIVDKMVANQLKSIPIKAESYDDLSRSDFQTLLQISEMQLKAREIESQFKRTLIGRLTARADEGAMIDVTGVLQDSISGAGLTNRQVLLMDDSGEVLKVTTTNGSGQFRFTSVRNSGHLYLRTADLLEQGKERPLLANLKQTLAAKKQIGKFENIYFDFNHYTLRPEARQVLNELGRYLIEYPSLQVELYAYADDLGADDYNMTLTQKRGNAVLDYLISLGVDETGVAVTARGKQKNPKSDVELQRQFNRRVEFYINGPDIAIIHDTRTYILKSKTDWLTLAHSTKIPVDKLRKLNGAGSETLQLFQPVRLPASATVDASQLYVELN